MKFAFIFAWKATWPIRPMARVLDVSKSGYYAWLKRPETEREASDGRLALAVADAHAQSRGTYGSPRVHAELRARGIRVSRKRIIRVMRAQGLKGRIVRQWTRTTEADPAAVPAPNLLDRDFTASKPNERWVGDVTYLRTPAGWLYLAAVMDLFSRRIVGWAISPYNDRKLAKAGLSDALRRRRSGPGYLHHTDRGSPYTSDDYQRLLDDSGALCSMSRKGNCLDNAAMESWFATLKAELGETFGSFVDARRQLFDFIEVFYNRQRRHSSLGYRSPAEFEAVGAP